MSCSAPSSSAPRHAEAPRSWNGRPKGPVAYNPYARGSATRDRRQGARRRGVHRAALPAPGTAVSRARGPCDARTRTLPVTPLSLMEHMDPAQLEATARELPDAERPSRDAEVPGRAHRPSEAGPRRHPGPAVDPRRVRRPAMARKPDRQARALTSSRPSRSGPSCTSASSQTFGRCSRRSSPPRSSAT